jgi:hypothetical protein
VDAVAVLFPGTGSVPVSLTVIEFVIVEPPGAPGLTATTTVKPTAVEAAMVALAVQTIVPVAPTAGVVPHVHPAGGVADTKVVLAGVVCVSVAPTAATVVLLFVTVSV